MAVLMLGPGVSDYSTTLIGDYEYVDAGGYEKMIFDDSNIVVDARVDDYFVDGTKIYVARRPRMVHEATNRGRSAARSSLSSDCEYIVIDTFDHSVNYSGKSDSLSCIY